MMNRRQFLKKSAIFVLIPPLISSANFQFETPDWYPVPAIRNVTNLGPVLSDIENRMPPNHQYKAVRRVTFAHEATHGLNARIRNEAMKQYGGKLNAFYVLNGRAFVAEEPNIRLRDVTSRIPSELRGMSFNLYMNQQLRYWDDRPLYIFDEWSAYANGTATAISDTSAGGSFSDMLQTMEMFAYGCVLSNMINFNKRFEIFLFWAGQRTKNLYNICRTGPLASARLGSYWERMQKYEFIRRFL